MNEIHIAIDIYNYIDGQGEMGVSATELLDIYEDRAFLQRILMRLNEAKFVMKTGVCEVTYVHSKHIRPWVVNTYHLKRLDRVSKLNALQHCFIPFFVCVDCVVVCIVIRKQLNRRQSPFFKFRASQALHLMENEKLKMTSMMMLSVQRLMNVQMQMKTKPWWWTKLL